MDSLESLTEFVADLPGEEGRLMRCMSKAHGVMDRDIAQGLEEQIERRNNPLACQSGCAVCCQNRAIAILSSEIEAISWYVVNRVDGAAKERLIERLKVQHNSRICPFVIDDVCQIYPVRPLACRAVHIFGEPCMAGEDVLAKRPGDVWYPGIDTAKAVSMEVLSWYGIDDPEEKVKAFEAEFLIEKTGSMQDHDWGVLVALMSK
ncbi:MAG: YkgJ family cysteine cluster protein [Magnetococcales bacterium]|nr:YkgJ family cysteine cluster protein [Magnetococcales bacterium]